MDSYHFLTAISLACINSIWQVGFIFLLYKLICIAFHPNNQTKYNIQIACSLICISIFVYDVFHVFPLKIESFYALNITLKNVLLQKILMIVGVFYFLFTVIYIIKNSIELIKVYRDINVIDSYFNPTIQKILKDVKQKFNINKNIIIKASKNNLVPFTIGYIKPIIVLPLAVINNLSVDEVESVIIHEMAHIKRNDFIVNIFLILTKSILWFNPVFNVFYNEIEETREACCDEMVVNYPIEKINYAQALLTISKINRASASSFSLYLNNNFLKNRISNLFIKKQNFEFKKVQFFSVLFFSVLFTSTMFLINQKPVEKEVFVSKFTPKVNIQTQKSLSKNIVQKRKTNENIKHNHINKHLPYNYNITKKSTDEILTTSKEIDELTLSKKLLEFGFKDLAQDIINKQLAESNKIEIVTVSNKKSNTLVEKFMLPATSNNPATLIVITTTKKANGKKEVMFEIENFGRKLD